MITAQQLAAALRAAANSLDGATGGDVSTLAHSAGPALSPALAQPAPVAAAPVGIDADAITALITPHIGNETLKTAFGAAMRGLGINALPETPAHMYGTLYQAFQAVIAQHAAAPASASII